MATQRNSDSDDELYSLPVGTYKIAEALSRRLAEISRRSDEIDVGDVETEDWSVMRERLFAKHGVRAAG